MSHRPRKRFGQNFLSDPNVIRRIVDAVAPAPADTVLEIGPGRGALTGPLLETGAEVHAVEIDRDLAAMLRETYASTPRFTLHQGDALRLDLAEVFAAQPIRVVGNLPYNISTPLIFRLLESPAELIDLHLMLQREVVERMAAPPGDKTYGRLSVTCQYHAVVTPLFRVPPGAFHPRPKVESMVVRLVPRREPLLDASAASALAALVNQAFSRRRKTLRNALAGMLDVERIEAAGIDPGLRPEVLGLDDYLVLARSMVEDAR